MGAKQLFFEGDFVRIEGTTTSGGRAESSTLELGVRNAFSEEIFISVGLVAEVEYRCKRGGYKLKGIPYHWIPEWLTKINTDPWSFIKDAS